MTTLEIILTIILYIVGFAFTYAKQLRASSCVGFNKEFEATITAIFWPITIIWYMIRATFFEDWL